MRELMIASADMNDELKAAMDSAKSLEDVAAWLDANKVKYAPYAVVAHQRRPGARIERASCWRCRKASCSSSAKVTAPC